MPASNGESLSQQAVCPSCDARQAVEPVNVITPASPELQALFKGDLNRIVCDECGTEFRLPTPVLYRYDEDRQLIYYVPLEKREGWYEAEQEMEKITRSIFQADDNAAVPGCRLTLTRRGFIEKIALLLAGRDDRIIEYIKYQLFQRPDSEIDPVRTELLYDFSNQDPNKLAFILFDRETGQPNAATHVPAELYDELVETFLDDEEMQEELDALFSGYFVNVEKLLGLC